MASSENISVYNLADLKNTADDALPNYLNSLKFRQSHLLTDVRLALGYGAFALAAACFLWDYRFGFDSTKRYTAIAVGLYTMLNGVLTYWIAEVEKGTVYQGTAPSGEKLTIATSTKKHDPTYRLSITIEPPTPKSTTKKGTTTTQKVQTIQFATPFAKFYDETGHFVARPFQESLASSIPLVGKLDPSRVKKVLVSQEMIDANPALLDAVLAAEKAESAGDGGEDGEGEESTTTTTTGMEVGDKKGGKRRKA